MRLACSWSSAPPTSLGWRRWSAAASAPEPRSSSWTPAPSGAESSAPPGSVPPMKSSMREFWDARAEENALFYIDNHLDYRAPNDAAFWAHGEALLDTLLDAVGARIEPDDDVVE